MENVEMLTDAEIEDKIIQARRRYHREWRAANKERTKKYNHDYWLKRAMAEDKNK